MMKFLIFLCFSMMTYTLKANYSVDTLSLDNAMKLAIKKHSAELHDSNTLAADETELLIDICTKYLKCLYYEECFKTITNSKELLIKQFQTTSCNDNAQFNLQSQSLMVDLDIKVLEYQIRLSECKSELNKALMIGEHKDYCLSTSLESVHMVYDSTHVLYNDSKVQSSCDDKIKLYHLNISLLQQLNTKKQLLKHKLQNTINVYKNDFDVLRSCVDEYITTQIESLSIVLELKMIYIYLTKLMVSKIN